MDDKDAPYKSYPTRPPLPPFSSLRPCSSLPDGGYGASERDSGHRTLLSQYQQQQQLYSFNSYLQDHHSHFHQQPPSVEYQRHPSLENLHRDNQPSQLSNYQTSSFHGNSTHGSNFQVKDQSQFLNRLQHPPIPDMSLSLPFSAGQSGMLGNSSIPVGIQSYSNSGLFRNNNDHPPQIPLSQVESFISEAEQKTISDFNAVPHTLDNRKVNSSWQSSYNSSVPGQSSEQLPSFSSFSSFYSKTPVAMANTRDPYFTSKSPMANTRDSYFTSESPNKSNKIDSFDNRFSIPESSSSFTPTSSIPGYATQYHVSGDSYSGNCFLPKQTNIVNSSGIHYSNFSGNKNNQGEQNMLPMHVQTNDASSRSGHPANSFVADQTSTVKKGHGKGRKKKNVSEESLDIEVKSLTKKKKPRVLKKSKGYPNQESSVLLSNTNNNQSVSPTFCLSPTFIASLSSKRAPDPHFLSDAPHTGHCIRPQDITPQRNHCIQGAQRTLHKDYQIAESHASYFGAPVITQSTALVSNNDHFQKPINSQMSYASVSFPSAKPVFQRNDSKHGSHIFNHHQTNQLYIPTIQSECKPNRNTFIESQTVETEEDEKSLSPFQLSPGFIASLSSKRAEEHPVQKSLMGTTPVLKPSLEPHSRPLSGVSCGSIYQSSRQPTYTSVSLSADRASVNHTHSEPQYSRTHMLDRPESYIPWNASFQKSLSQEFNFKNGPRQAGSPKQYVSPPAYPQGSEFQYPTPPMEDDESKLQSPGLCMSPKFLDSLSNKIATGELSHRLSPIPDDNMSVLPTPPNSAGPKQPYLPDITLSKEEQTSRILEIIAREREKISNAIQMSSMEPKKKKKRKSKEIGDVGDGPTMLNTQIPRQMELDNVSYCSEGTMDNDRFIGQPLHPYQTYSEMPVTTSVPASLPDSTNTFVKFSSNTNSEDIGNKTSIDYEFHHKQVQQQNMWPENNCEKFDPEKSSHRYDNSNLIRINDIYIKNEKLQRHLNNLHAAESQKHADVSSKVDAMSLNNDVYRASYNSTNQDLSVANHYSLTKPFPVHTPRMLDKEQVKTDPYAFDDSEQIDLSMSLTRNTKSGSNLPCTTFVKHLDGMPVTDSHFTIQTKSDGSKPILTSCNTLDSADSKLSYSNHMVKVENGQTTESLQNNAQQMSWGSINHLQNKQQIQSNKMFIENELPSPQSYNHELTQMKQQHDNQYKLELDSNKTHLLNTQHYHQKQQQILEDTSLKNSSGLSIHSEDTVIKQESLNLPHSTQQMKASHRSLSDSYSTLNGHVSNILKREVNESLELGGCKKKRGRPPKCMISTISSPLKSRVPKLKLQEKKFKVQTPKNIVYKVNGTEVNSSDLSLNQNLVDRLANNLMEVADCNCLGLDHVPSEFTEGPYYTQLGAARDIPGVRKVLEQRTGLSGSAIRIEKVIFTGKEGKSKEGCPIAKWIIRRSGPEEKYLCIVRKRPGHFCDTAVIIISIVAWEGVGQHQADTLYDFLISTLPQNGLETDRRCGLNEKKTCACQGVDLLRRGASFSFGCSWSMYYNGCKFARSQMARKFKLKDPDCEDELEDKLEKLATDVAPLYSQLAPDAFRNQIQFENQAEDCRLGRQPGRPFSGVTAVVDFCCHSHRDCHNMNNGSTVVVNLTKHRGFEKPDDEQYHVLPLYILDQTDELGTMEGQMAKVRNGSLEVLSRYMSQVRRRSTPYRPCQRNRTATKKQGLKKGPRKSKLVKAKSFAQPGDKTSSKSESSNFSEDEFLVQQSPSMDKMRSANEGNHAVNMVPGVGLDERNPESMSYSDLMSQQGTPGFGDLYSKFWDYFYTHGEFPPCEWMTKKRFSVTSKEMSSSFTSNMLIQPTAADQMFLRGQKWQHQEQRRLQQFKDQAQEGQSQQQENHRQQNLPSHFAGKQDFHSQSPSPQSPYPPMSPRQQHHHSHDYHFETTIPMTPQASSQLHTPSIPPHQGSFPHNRQQCIPTPLSSSMPLTSFKLQQQQHTSEPLQTSDQSQFMFTTPKHHSLEASRSSTMCLTPHPDRCHKENNVACLPPSSRNSPICSQSTALVSHVVTGGRNEHPVTSPPPYHQSISNQHNMQCSPQEALCSFKPQGPPPPPSYCESLAQSSHNIVKFDGSQGDVHVGRFPSTHSAEGPQLGSHLYAFSQSVQFSSSENVTKLSPSAELLKGPTISREVQRSALRTSSERPQSSMSVSRPQSSEEQRPQSQRPQSAQAITRPFSAQSVDRMSTQSMSGNTYMQPISCPASVQPSSVSGLQQKPTCSAQIMKRPSSALSILRPSLEHSVPKSLSSQFLERGQSSCSVDGSQFSQREHRPLSSHSTDMSPTQQLITSDRWSVNQQHCYQTSSQGADSFMEKPTVEYNEFDSLKLNSYLTGKPESCITDTATFSSDDKQVKYRRERCWSRMSEPSTVAEITRPSSCSSESGLLSGWSKHRYNLVPPDILITRHDSKVQNCSRPNSLHSNLHNSKIVNTENTEQLQSYQKLEAKDRESAIKQELYNIRDSSCLMQSGYLNTTGEYNSQHNIKQGKESSSDEIKYGDIFGNGPAGTVCPNGPVIGEKMKVHKSEGFVVPKLGQGPSEPPYEVIDSTVSSEETDDNREAFNDPAMGGVAIALCHGAVLFEVAKRELHATTALKEPNRYQPKRISLVFYQHKNLNLTRHGFEEYERKIEERRNQAEQARLIEEMESKGFFKGELSELASFPHLTKGTFGKVFNFPESRETLFPLRFPRYLDRSHSEHITPVMFACMSIAFPNYMKAAFLNPSKLPRLMSSHMPGRMNSSLSDKKAYFKPADSEMNSKELQYLLDKCENSGDIFQRVASPWNPNIPHENTVTTDSVITRWVHDDVSVTGPYNRWVELALHCNIKKEEKDVSLEIEAESEADLKEKMFESLSELDNEAYISSSDMSSVSLKYTDLNMRTSQENQDTSTPTMVVNLEPPQFRSLEQPMLSFKSSEKGILLHPSSVYNNEHNETSKELITVVKDSTKFSDSESSEGLNSRPERSDYNDYSHQRMFDGKMPSELAYNNSVVDGKSEPIDKTSNTTTLSPGTTETASQPYKNQGIHDALMQNLFSHRKMMDIDKLKAVDSVNESIYSNFPVQKLVAKDENLNHTESACKSDAVIAISGYTSVLRNQADSDNDTLKVEAKDVTRPGIKRRESVYDFLMKGLNKTYLSSQPNGAQGMSEEYPSGTQNECT